MFLVNMHGLFLWKIKKALTFTNAFPKVLNESKRKPNKIWVDKDSEFYNRSLKLFFQNNDIEMYWTHNEETSVVIERFIRTLKNKIYKYMTSISKSVFIDKLDDIVNKYNITYHRTIKWSLLMSIQAHKLTLIQKIIRKLLNLKFAIM